MGASSEVTTKRGVSSVCLTSALTMTRQVSLSRLNHGLPWAQAHPEVMQGTAEFGFDHGVGHPLLLLYDAKTPRGQKIKEFNGLGDDPFNASISLF